MVFEKLVSKKRHSKRHFENCSLKKRHFRNYSHEKNIFKIYFFKIALSKNTEILFSNLLPQKIYFQNCYLKVAHSENINLIAFICSSSNSTD